MGRAEEYDRLQRRDVQLAFRRAYDEIETAQNNLRDVNPRNLLLGLIKLRPSKDGLDFGEYFGPVVMEHSSVSNDSNWYFALGVYVDLLESELLAPRFL